MGTTNLSVNVNGGLQVKEKTNINPILIENSFKKQILFNLINSTEHNRKDD